jgi:hypothetical protein
MLADGNGNDNNFVISRYFGAEKLSLAIWNVGGGPPACQGEVDINQGVWTTLIFRYSQSADKIDVLINGQYALNPKACEIPPADLTVNNAWVAKSNVEGDPYANLKLAGLVIVDGYMSDDDAVATGAALNPRISLYPNQIVGIHPGNKIPRWGRFSEDDPARQPTLAVRNGSQYVKFEKSTEARLNGGPLALNFQSAGER